MAADLDYSSYQDIREESGHQNLSKLEDLSGVVNGSNTVFYVGRTYIVDRDYNDTIDVATTSGDVIVYDDDVAVTVSAVDVNTGAITLGSAPVADSVMLATYAYSVLSDAGIDKYRKEAISYVQRKLDGIIDFESWTSETLPPIIKTVVRIYAAGLILIRDYGLSTDTDESSKDGYKRLSIAKSLLSEYIEEVSSSAGGVARVSVSSRSDGNIFERNTDLSTWNESVSATQSFMER